ncbi:IS481 family transposase [Motilibacter aurantiacus]|uniref:IS481 family transposase n=1 Tax=Motilibacter aurantiacus TaxID=2714955 RepID=UPI00140B32D5|nr:IS481 family transposase [Motilibacter aurantiacus]
MAHANARLTVHGRLLLVRRVRSDGRPVAHVAKELGVSRQCAHRWVARYDAEGPAGLLDRSSRPHSTPTRTSAEAEQRVLAARAQHRRGPAWLGAECGVPERTVTRVLRRHDVPRLAECDPLTGDRIRASKTTAVRYERARPGELIHMDVKKIGRIPDGGGWRAHGRQMGSTAAKKKARIGFDYVHSAVDDHSRLAYSEVLPDEKGSTCAAFLARAAASFRAAGITTVERVMTDNHWSYTRSADMTSVLHDLGARHVLIKPHCPWQNGNVERFNRTLQAEWAYRQVFTSNAERTAALVPWLEHYNNERAHHALKGAVPASRLPVSPT